MSLTNPYCTLADLKEALRITDTNDDNRLTRNINAASRQIDNYTRRRFYLDGGVSDRDYVPTSAFLVMVDDFQTTTGLVVKTDPTGNGSFPITWDAADYQLEPLNQMQEGQPWVYNRIRSARNLIFPVWGAGMGWPVPVVKATVRVTAKWGWTAIPDEVNQACIYQASMLYKMEDVPLGATPFDQTGVLNLKAALHPGAVALLGDYDSTGVLIG